MGLSGPIIVLIICVVDLSPEAHVCAVVSRTGRAYCGKHGAHICWLAWRRTPSHGQCCHTHPVRRKQQCNRCRASHHRARRREAAVAKTGQMAPVTPPKAAPVTPPKAPAVAPAQSKATPKLQPQPKAKKAATTSSKPLPGHLGISCVLGVFILDDGNVASSMQGLCKRSLQWINSSMQGLW